jgi:hypothetical protein
MPEIKMIALSHKEVTEALIKYQGLHEGIWQLYVEFGIAAANVAFGAEENFPSAIVPIKKIGLHRVEKETPLALDAAKINPK